MRVSGNASLIPALEPLIAHPPLDSWIVLGAGDLRKTSPLRRLFENTKNAAAIPCYADSARDLDRIIDEVTREAGLRIAADARALLRSLLGGDRLVSRSELAKLALYVGEGEITVEDVLSVVGDASAFAVDEAVDAVAAGDTPTLVRSYRRLLAAGTPDFVVAGAALRHFDALHRARALFDQGDDAGSVVGPQVFQKRREAMAKAIAAWPIARIERAIAVLDRAIADSRLQNAISAEVIGQALMTVVAMAPGARARPQPATAS